MPKRQRHGGTGTRLYRIWKHIHCRCYNPNDNRYELYGGRGITLCNDWHSFISFRNWAIPAGYADNLSIERIDANEGYSPNNCCWATSSQQAQHHRKRRDNTTGFIGVCKRIFFEIYVYYHASARFSGKRVSLGYFDNPIEAAKARDAFVKLHYTNPVLNFP